MTAPKLALQLCVSFWLATAATATLSQTIRLHKMVDSGFPAEDNFPIAWVDNDRLLFTGVELGERAERPLQPGYSHGLKHAAYMWDTRKNVVAKFRDTTLGTLCTNKAYISYRIVESWEEKRVAIYAGEFGSEIKLRLPEKYWFNRMSCRYFTKPPIWAQRQMAGRWIQPLLDEHGFIDYGPIDLSKGTPETFRNTPYVFWSADGKTSKRLEIEPRYREQRPLRFAYVPFANQYFARAATTDISSVVPAFFLDPHGEIRKMEIPKGPWDGRRYLAVRDGILLVSKLRRSFSDPGNAGVFLLINGNARKLVTGMPKQVTVSPDGCKVAFEYAWSQQERIDGYKAWRQGRVANTIRMVDICDGEDRG